jgi:hypothetical protein
MSAKSQKAQATPPSGPNIADLRTAIDRAETSGIDRGDMLLHLTFRDEAMIKRSRSVGVDEVSFADGQMRFMGVKVVVASGGASSLEAPATA